MLTLQDLEAIQKLDMKSIEVEFVEGGININFTDEEVLNKIQEIADKAFPDSKDSLEDALSQILAMAESQISDEIPEHAKTEKMKNE